MAERQQEQQAEVPAKEQSAAASSAETKNTDTQPQELMIPKHRYDEVSKRLQDLERQQADRDKAQQAENERKLAEQQQWQQLAESHKSKLDELEPANTKLAERNAKLEEMLAKQLEAEIAAWPDEVKALDPGKDADLLQRWEWAGKSRALAEKLSGQPPIPGNGRRPQPTGAAGQQQNEQKARASQERWAHNQF